MNLNNHVQDDDHWFKGVVIAAASVSLLYFIIAFVSLKFAGIVP
jgi:hypothetical protein